MICGLKMINALNLELKVGYVESIGSNPGDRDASLILKEMFVAGILFSRLPWHTLMRLLIISEAAFEFK